jgi:cytochrome c oxidase subunit 2
MRRTANLVAATVVLGAVLGGCGGAHQSIVNAKGSEAQRIAGVWWLMFGLAAAVYVIVAGFILVGAFRGRRTETGKPSRLTDDGLIWVGGLIVPTLILIVLAVVTVQSSTHLRVTQKGALRIEVVGKQWWWQVTYPDTGFETANEIHIPVGRQVIIGLDSDNVIHSFWVPPLAGKVDTIPGQHNQLVFTAEQPGVYIGHCAEYCGIQHANMNFAVIAQPEGLRSVARATPEPADRTEQRPPGTGAARVRVPAVRRVSHDRGDHRPGQGRARPQRHR